MRFSPLKIFSLFIFTIFILSSCSDKTEQFETELLSEYMPLAPGKYITYRVDSLVFPDFGRSTAIHKYQQKNVADILVTDNLGRPSWRVFRYIRDSVDVTSWTPAQPWVPNGSYLVTILPTEVEVIEDNLRFVKLHAPIREGYTWKGNSHIPFNPYDYVSTNNSYDDGLADWDYIYDHFDASLFYKGKTYTDVWTIEAADEAYNVPVTLPDSYGSRIRSVEKYSKSIGLVYREHELWEYQPNTGQPGGAYKTGFGVTMWMIDHN